MNANSLPSIKETVLIHKLFPHKSKGQHFIYDSKITDRIASLSGDLTNSIIYEVGPGPGGLTRSLLNFGAKKIIAAMGAEPNLINKITPPIMVLGSDCPS